MASLTTENQSMEIAMNTLSERGRHATKPMTSYFSDYLKAISDKYDPVENPNGYISLCVASVHRDNVHFYRVNVSKFR